MKKSKVPRPGPMRLNRLSLVEYEKFDRPLVDYEKFDRLLVDYGKVDRLLVD